MQAHKLHQHLVGVGRAVKGASADPVIRGHLGRHQRIAADLSIGKSIADAGFFFIGQARGHGASRHEHRWNMAKGRRSDDQSGNDLVTNA